MELTTSAKPLRQYFNFVRPGAVRVAATASGGTLQPIAFTNANGKRVVVAKTNGVATFNVAGFYQRYKFADLDRWSYHGRTMAKVDKISISLSPDDAKWARVRAKKLKTSVSSAP